MDFETIVNILERAMLVMNDICLHIKLWLSNITDWTKSTSTEETKRPWKPVTVAHRESRPLGQRQRHVKGKLPSLLVSYPGGEFITLPNMGCFFCLQTSRICMELFGLHARCVCDACLTGGAVWVANRARDLKSSFHSTRRHSRRLAVLL